GVAFLADDGIHGQELWFSDGTPAGTQLVMDVNPDPSFNSGNSNIQNLTAVGSQLFFSARDAAHGQELWVSDGTQSGTHLVKDIIAGTSGFNPSQFIAFNGKFYFVGNDGVNGTQLWTSDGTAAGTTAISSNSLGASPSNFTIVGGNKLFYTGSDSVNSSSIYMFDGTTITPVATHGGYSSLSDIGGKLGFIFNDGTNGNELYVTDGVTAPT